MELIQDEQHRQDDFHSVERRQRTWRIVIAHLLIVGAFFAATFFWGNFT